MFKLPTVDKDANLLGGLVNDKWAEALHLRANTLPFPALHFFAIPLWLVFRFHVSTWDVWNKSMCFCSSWCNDAWSHIWVHWCRQNQWIPCSLTTRLSLVLRFYSYSPPYLISQEPHPSVSVIILRFWRLNHSFWRQVFRSISPFERCSLLIYPTLSDIKVSCVRIPYLQRNLIFEYWHVPSPTIVPGVVLAPTVLYYK